MTRDHVIRSLRELADLLEAKPDFMMPFNIGGDQPLQFRRYLWSKDELFEGARRLGSFKKRYNDDYFECVVKLPSGAELVYYCDRDKVCKRIVTYDCEDAESILLSIPEPQGEAMDDIPF